ncbi:sigma-70 family RNA polymerase sigma factor [Oscillibacter hominis]|uniref:Sigma-70 family RNA polymerase sigma factor n=1 Tax=Oscillibacter hominis TaxID=2763056 RepID=A0A7G9B5C3_9FIRM|nr:sigma-70 family RNA polymerase sigma factor [Oscillibacter hominis]QNL44754.1 sigma-70 family RNA polymerase sigma factor [Oscillibacter hominis]
MSPGGSYHRQRSAAGRWPATTNESFDQLVIQYERLVYTVCRQMVQDSAAAEDLTQETFLSAYTHRDSCPEGYAKQWLARIAVNKAKDYLQSAYRRRTVLPGDDALPLATAPPLESQAIARSEASAIANMIRAMKEPYRRVCVMALLEEKKPEEIALALGRPVKTIHTQLSRGKRLLREELERRERNGTIS